MSGLLTKTAVLEAKSSGKSTVDYEQVAELAGGNYSQIRSTVLFRLMGRYKPEVLKAKYQTGKDMASKQGVNVQSIQDKLTKYLKASN